MCITRRRRAAAVRILRHRQTSASDLALTGNTASEYSGGRGGGGICQVPVIVQYAIVSHSEPRETLTKWPPDKATSNKAAWEKRAWDKMVSVSATWPETKRCQREDSIGQIALRQPTLRSDHVLILDRRGDYPFNTYTTIKWTKKLTSCGVIHKYFRFICLELLVSESK